MNRKILSEGKRLRECYTCDPDFRKLFEEDPDRAIHTAGLSMEASSAREILFSKDPEVLKRNEFFTSFQEWLDKVHASVSRNTCKESFSHPGLWDFNQRVRNRQKLENRSFRYKETIHYFPLLIELARGCSVQCPFCGLAAGPLTSVFRYTEENARLFRSVIRISLEKMGRAAGAGALYFATEPLDNPDYESFLMDFRDLTGTVPQTTTAVADRYPDRIRSLMKKLGDDRVELAAFRFSVRTLAQFRKVTALYSPDELVYVELIPNNPESLYSYSSSGRAGDYLDHLETGKNSQNYSISCCAGFRVNFAEGMLYCEEPVMPDASFPTGVRTRARASFSDAASYEQALEDMLEEEMGPDIFRKKQFMLNPCVTMMVSDDTITLTGDGFGCHLRGREVLEESIQMLKEAPAYLDELPYRETEAWKRLYEKGYLIDLPTSGQNPSAGPAGRAF